MSFTPRPYQTDAINNSIDFFNDKREKKNGLVIAPTGCGKSVIIANIAGKLPGKTLILQPSKEILEQNFAKFLSYGYRAGVYSASAGMKFMDTVTFATIGSIAKKHHIVESVDRIIIDECHLVNPEAGMYHDLIHSFEKIKVLGLTATPYRLGSSMDGAMLKFITRQSPRIFNKVLYEIQNDILFNAGYLAPLQYFSFKVIDRAKLETNSTGTDFNEQKLKQYYRDIDMPEKIIHYANRILTKRKNLLVFCSMISEANTVAAGIPGAVVLTGETDPGQRASILKSFKSGIIKCVINVGVLTTGFDYPALEAVLIGRSTMSLALYYQIIGRVMRPYTYPGGTKKVGWIVDLGDNIRMFGKIETMKIMQDDRGLYSVWNVVNGIGRQLTNVNFRKS